MRDLLRHISDRDDCAHFNDDEIVMAAQFFFEFGLSSTWDLMRTRSLNRASMLGDMRINGRSAREHRVSTALLRLFPPPAQKTTGKEGQFAECCIPRSISSFAADFSAPSPPITPDRAMANEIPRQLSRKRLSLLYPIRDRRLTDEPWKPKLSTSDRSAEGRNSRMAGLRPDQPLSLQSYLFYSIRFIFVAHMCSKWELFGGLSAPFSDLATLMNLAAVANSGVAIAYDIATRIHIGQLDRQRRYDIDYVRLLSGEMRTSKRRTIPNDPLISRAMPLPPIQKESVAVVMPKAPIESSGAIGVTRIRNLPDLSISAIIGRPAGILPISGIRDGVLDREDARVFIHLISPIQQGREEEGGCQRMK